MRRFLLVAGCLATAVSGCATAIQGTAENISRLEAARAKSPSSEAAVRTLGIAYFNGQRYGEARTTLQQAVSMDANDGVAALYLGLTAEAQNDLPAAHDAYASYLRVGKTDRVKKQIEAKLAALARKELDVATKQAVAREAQLSATPGPANSVAVLPFRFTGQDTSLKPLERGFAELLTTDLTRISRLTVVDRARIQALLDELTLQQGAAAAEGVRAGKILQASQLVGGNLNQQGNQQIQTTATITSVQTSQGPRTAGSTQTSLDAIFDAEKTIALNVVQAMGVTLTVAEQNAIQQRPTRSLQAFLAFSRGLQAEDQGRFDDASALFNDAVRIDPNFGAAQQKSVETRNISAGNQVNARSVESGLRGTSEGAAVSSAQSTNLGGGAVSVAQELIPSAAGGATGGSGQTGTTPTQTAGEGTQASNPTTKTAKVTIIITPPKP